MEGRVRDHRGERSARDAGRTRARLGWNEAANAAGIASAGLHDGCDGIARRRQTDRERNFIFHSARFQRERRSFLRAVRRTKRSNVEIELARPGVSRLVFAGGTIGAIGRIQRTWRVSYYGRDYPQQWTSRGGNERFNVLSVTNSRFGANFLSILDAYRYVERSIKYGVLFLVLVFTTFFLFEVTARQKIHPFQYLMVGAALCLFYLLLLSISEFIGFSWAYLVAAVASTLLITWYCNFFLGGGARTLMIGAGLAGVYTFLYITLRQQDYALLMGAIALFIVLAIVMYVTRKVDWYARDVS